MIEKNNRLYLTLEKAIKVLNFLVENESPQGIREIARQLNMNVSTVNRILFTLNKYKYVRKVENIKKYSLGIRLFEIGNVFFKRLNIKDNVFPILEKLMLDTQETVSLTVYSKGERVYLIILRSSQPIQTIAFEGKRELLHKSAGGKAIMAYLSEEEIDWIIKEKGLPKYTNKTITDANKLRGELKKIRSCGFAIDNGEGEEEIRCVAAPVFDYKKRVVGAISVSVPAYRFNSEKLNKFKELVCNAAKEIYSSLGYLYIDSY